MDLNRRQILCGLGGIACGAACAGLINPKEDAHAASEKMQRFQQAGGDFGWKPHKLDVEAVQKVAYEAYHNKGYACGYGVFNSIVGSLAEQYGAPYNQFPFSMLEVFKGGISDWGTICGCLGGAASAYALFWGRKERDAMVDELFHWYSTTNLPIYNPADAKVSLRQDQAHHRRIPALPHFRLPLVRRQRHRRKEQGTQRTLRKADRRHGRQGLRNFQRQD